MVFEDIANGMASKGHDVFVISQKLSNHHDNPRPGLSIYRVKPLISHPPPPSILENILFMLFAIMKGFEIIRKEKIDIIHSNNFASVIVGKVLSKILNISLITTIHNVYDSTPNLWNSWAQQEGISKFSKYLGPFLEKTTVKINADLIHTVSNSTQADIRKLNKRSRIKVIRNGIYPEKYSQFYKSEFNDTVVCIGRLVFYKNVNLIISIFPLVLKEMPQAKLIIIGEGPLKKDLEKIVMEKGLKENVVFKGFVSNTEKFDILSKSTCLLLPSLSEGLPMVVLESFAIGKPVIMSDIKCSSELIDDNVDGFVISPNDPDKWAEKIAYLLKNKIICKKMGEAAQNKIDQLFNLNLILNQFEDEYKNLSKN